MIGRACLAGLLALAGACAVQPEPALEPVSEPAGAALPETGLSGWREVVVTTRDPQPWLDFFVELAGWEVRADGEIDDGLKTLWDLPETAAGREILLANTGAETGFLRLVHLTGVEQDWIRADDRPWDTGGLFDFNVRVVGLYELREDMLNLGWQGDSAPIQYTFGPFEVIEWIARGPDGVRIAFIERLKPELEGWPNLKTVSRVFNATGSVADMKASLGFFRDGLGMETYLEHRGASDKPGPNVLGLPHEAAATVDRIVYILHPDGVNEGSIELLAFDGASGNDLSDKAKPGNIGLSAMRYPVVDLDATLAALEARGVMPEGPPVEVKIAPYGTVRTAVIVSPDGVWMEIFGP